MRIHIFFLRQKEVKETNIITLGTTFKQDEQNIVVNLYLDTFVTAYDLLKTLFHKLIHVKEIIKGNLVLNTGIENIVLWLGKNAPLSDDFGGKCEIYQTSPWEVEARVAPKFAKMFLQEKNKYTI